MAAIDIPPGIGLTGTPLGIYRPPAGPRRLSRWALAIVIALGAVTWANVSRHPYRWHASTQIVLPGLKVGLDGYYKIAKNLIDEGQFCAPLILTQPRAGYRLAPE